MNSVPHPIQKKEQENSMLHIHMKKTKSNGTTKKKQNDDSKMGSYYQKRIFHPPFKTKLNTTTSTWLTDRNNSNLPEGPSTRYNWDSTKALLEINQPRVDLNVRDPKTGVLRYRDVMREANNQVQDHMKNYNTKIKGLMTEVGSLKNEARALSVQVHQKNVLKEAEIKLLEGKILNEIPIGVNRHLNCFKEPGDTNPVDDRVKKTLNRMIDHAAKVKKREETAALQDSNHFVNDDQMIPTKEDGIDEKLNSPPVQESTRLGTSENVCQPTAGFSPLEVSLLESELAKKQWELQETKLDYDEKQRELQEVVDELNEIKKHRQCVMNNIHRYQEDVTTNLEFFEEANSDDNGLYCQLLALETNGCDARRQVAALRDVVQRVKNDYPLATSDLNALNKQRELMTKKLMQFDICNKTARKLVVAEEKILRKFNNLQKDISALMLKISDSDANRADLHLELEEKNAHIKECNEELQDLSKLRGSVDASQNLNNGTCCHLQKAVADKEYANQKLRDQLTKAKALFQEAIEQQQNDSEDPGGPAMRTMQELKALRKEMSVQHHRAKAAEQELAQAQELLERREQEIADTVAQTQNFKIRCIELSNQESILEDRLALLEQKATASRKQQCPFDDTNMIMRQKMEKLRNDNCKLRSEIDGYERRAGSAKERCLKAQDNVTLLLEDLRLHRLEHIDLVEELQQTQLDTAGFCACDQPPPKTQPTCMYYDTVEELDRFHDHMMIKLKGLEPMPAMLQKAEDSLLKTLQKIDAYDEKSIEQTRLIHELLKKKETTEETKSKLQEKITDLNNENHLLLSQVGTLSNRYEDRNSRFLSTRSSAEGLDWEIRQLENEVNRTVGEKNRLKKLLKSVTKEKRTSVTAEIGKAITKNRLDHSRIMDLETQLDRLESDANVISKNKRKFELRSFQQLEDVEKKVERSRASTTNMKNSVSSFKISNPDLFERRSSAYF